MPAIVNLVSAISSDVVAKLAAAGYPALVDGKILLGRYHLAEASAAPRILFVPVASKFGPKDPTSPNPTTVYPSAEVRRERQQRAIASEIVQFEVHCWGQDPSATDTDLDFDFTQALYQVLLQSLHDLCEGCYHIDTGKWTTGAQGASQLERAGQEFVCVLGIATPVLDQLLPYAAATTIVNVHGATDIAHTPITITTTTPHGMAPTSALTVTIAAVTGQTLANGSWTATVTGTSTFTIAQNGDGAHTYTGGGTVTIPGVSGAVGVTEMDTTGHVLDHVDVR